MASENDSRAEDDRAAESGAESDADPRPHPHGDRGYEWVGSLSARRARLSPDRVAVTDTAANAEYTYAELDQRANRTARFLRDAGVETGDRVAVVSRNRVELVDLFFATGKTGAVLAPLSHRLAERDLSAVLGTVDPELLLVETPFEGDVIDALERALVFWTVWLPPLLPRWRQRSTFAAHLCPAAPVNEVSLPRAHWATLFPEDLPDPFAGQTVDILLTHEAAGTHRRGFIELDQAAQHSGASLVLHGHLHEDYDATLNGGTRVYGLGKQQIFIFTAGMWDNLTSGA